MPLNTPILFLVFNRPDTTARVFEAIAKQQPKHLFIAADGPRLNKTGEAELCKKVREITTNITWPCEVKTLYRNQNLGCKIAVSSAIDWFFSEVEEGIILEDDCLPHPDFFTFCENMLSKFRNRYDIMHINGYAPIYQLNTSRFSNYISIWGWASWKRAWKLYDVNASYYRAFKIQKLLKNIFPKNYFLIESFIDNVIKGLYNTWDLQWAIAIHIYFGKSVLPNKNLIQNIGFEGNSTHTKESDKSRLSITTNDGKLNTSLDKNYQKISDLDDEIIGYFNQHNLIIKSIRYLKNKAKSEKK